MRKWAMILLLSAAFCLAANAECPQFKPGLQVGTVAHGLLDEISGIAASRKNYDVFWVHNDDGPPQVWALNSQGTHLGVYNLSGATNRDWEDIAVGPGPVDGVDYLYVGDIGDKNGNYEYITVYRVAEPVVDSNRPPVTETLTDVAAINLQYPDGGRDAETLMVDPVTRDLYIISKRDAFSRVYRAPYPQSTTTTTTMEYKCELPWGRAAGGDISLGGDMIIVRTGDGGIDVASIWLRPEGTDLWHAFSGAECAVELLSEENGEAVCFDANGCGYYTTSEQNKNNPQPVPIHYFARDGQCPEPPPIPCDFDTSGKVDHNDLSFLLEWWLLRELSVDFAPDGGDGVVNFFDWAVFADCWREPYDMADLAVFAEQWLWVGASSDQIGPVDMAPDGGDGIINLLDFAIFAQYWLLSIQ
ncbi:MAG: hypothetical protein ACYS76_02470 [Planctomycetota bacterium]